MTWHENIEDFGEQLKPGSTFRFECHPGLACFGRCCATDVSLTPYDIARMRRHLAMDSHQFLSAYCLSRIDSRTGFPYVLLKRQEDGPCVLLESQGCSIYESRPSCCRHYPLARVIEDLGQRGNPLSTYHLQRGAGYCEGMDRGPEWTVETYCKENGLKPYERANDLFLQIPFVFEALPLDLKKDKDVQTMIYQAVFDFDRFFEKYGRFGPATPPEDDDELMRVLTEITLNLIQRTADIKAKA